MLLKNIASQGIFLYEYVIATGAPATGDSANITGYWSLDGATATVFGTTNPTELSSTHMPGVYWQPLAQGETNGNAIAYAWKSSTSGNAINPVVVLTTGVSLPVAAPGAAGGAFIAGTNAATTITTSLTTHLVGTVDTVTTVTNQLTAAAIATAHWQDTTAGDFTVSGSIGKSLFTSGAVPGAAGGLFIAGTNAATTITTSLTTHLIGTVDTVTTVTNQLTAAAIATGVWQDSTAGDFTTASSIGKSLYTSGVVPGGTNGLFIAGTNAATIITTSLTTHFVGTIDTLTTYTGDTPQTGDSFGRIGALGAGLTALASQASITSLSSAVGTPAQAATALSTDQWTNTRAGYQDNLSGGAVALASGVILTAAGMDDVVVETGLNARQSLSIIAAACGGVSSGVNAGSPVYKGAGVATTRISATASNGDRSSVTLSPPS